MEQSPLKNIQVRPSECLIIEGLGPIPDSGKAPSQVGGIRQKTHAPQDGLQARTPGEPEEKAQDLAFPKSPKSSKSGCQQGPTK